MSRLIVAIIAATATCAIAQDKGEARQSRERELLRRQADEMRSLEAERNRLNQDNAKLQTDLKKAQDETLKASRSQRQAQRASELEKQAEALMAERDQARTEIEKLGRQLAEQRQQLNELRKLLAVANGRGSELEAAVTDRTSKLEACAAHNGKLVTYSREILDRLSDGTCKRAPEARWDPLLQFGRVRFEQSIEEYRAKVAAQRFVLP